MNDELLPGLEFALSHNLTNKEIRVLLPFLKEERTAEKIATYIGSRTGSIYPIIQRLRLKGILILKDKGEGGACLYGINENLNLG